MKLLKHEYILGSITIIFTVFLFFFAAHTRSVINEAKPAPSSAKPYIVNINTADASELNILDGISQKAAEEIVKYRTRKGDFRNIKDLEKVPRIGDTTIDQIKDYIIF